MMTLKLKNTNFIKKSSISINSIDINKIEVSNKLLFGKKDFNIPLVAKILKKLDLYAYSVHKSDCL